MIIKFLGTKDVVQLVVLPGMQEALGLSPSMTQTGHSSVLVHAGIPVIIRPK